MSIDDKAKIPETSGICADVTNRDVTRDVLEPAIVTVELSNVTDNPPEATGAPVGMTMLPLGLKEEKNNVCSDVSDVDAIAGNPPVSREPTLDTTNVDRFIPRDAHVLDEVGKLPPKVHVVLAPQMVSDTSPALVEQSTPDQSHLDATAPQEVVALIELRRSFNAA